MIADVSTPNREPGPSLDSDPTTWPMSGAGARTGRDTPSAAGWMFGPGVFMAMPSATALLAPSGIVIEVNAQWRRMTGDDAADDAGGPLWRRFAPAERSHIAALIERARDAADVPDHRPLVTGTQVRLADGRCLDVALRVGATRDSGALVLIAQMEQLAEPHHTRRRSGTGDRHLALATIARSVSTGVDLRRISETVVAAVARATGCPLVGLWRRASRSENLVLVEGLGFGPGTRGNLVMEGSEDGLADHTIRSRGAVIIGGPTGTAARIPRVLAERGVSSGVAVPLHGIAGSDGLLTVSAAHNQPMDHDDIRFLGIVGDLLTMTLQRESVDRVIAGERQRTASVAHDLDNLERRHRIAVAAADLRDWCWTKPAAVTPDRRMDPPPRWSVQICLDGGPQALVDCAVDDDVDGVVDALNSVFEQHNDLDVTARLRTTEGVVAVRLHGVVERDRDGEVREVWGLAAVTPAADPPASAPVEGAGDDRLAHTAHDLNNLLAAVLGTAQQLLEDGGDRRRLTAIVRAGRRARELVAGLPPGGDDAHPLAGAYDLADVVDQLRPLLHGLVGPGVHLVFQLGRGARTSHPSREELEHVLLDLVANSRDALTDGGTVVVATDTCVQLEEAAGPQAPPAGSWARLRVCDNGVGMSAQDRERVFASGYSTKSGHDHAGLGLTAVHHAIAGAGGTVGIDSAPGHGTVVDLYLPLAARQTARLQPLRPAPLSNGAPPAPDTAARTALIVDDEPALRHLLPELLGRLGYDAVVAGDGASALEIAGELDRLDLIVTDLLMPQMNGLELARRVRNIHGRAAVVLLSGAPPTTPIADRNLRVLRKPFEWNDLRDAVLSLTVRDATSAVAMRASLPAVSGR